MKPAAPTRVCLAIPVADSVPGEIHASLLTLAVSLGRVADVVIPSVVGVFPYDRARKALIDAAIENSCNELLFVDADMGVPLGTYEILKKSLGLAVVASGHTYRRGWPYTPTWFKRREGQSFQVTAPAGSGNHEIDACGLACTLINLDWVQENLEPPYFVTSENESEDCFFCRKVREAGGTILGVSDLRVDHLGCRWPVNDQTADAFRKFHIRHKFCGSDKESNEGDSESTDLSPTLDFSTDLSHELVPSSNL